MHIDFVFGFCVSRGFVSCLMLGAGVGLTVSVFRNFQKNAITVIQKGTFTGLRSLPLL